MTMVDGRYCMAPDEGPVTKIDWPEAASLPGVEGAVVRTAPVQMPAPIARRSRLTVVARLVRRIMGVAVLAVFSSMADVSGLCLESLCIV
jgi:hypothetical protein